MITLRGKTADGRARSSFTGTRSRIVALALLTALFAGCGKRDGSELALKAPVGPPGPAPGFARFVNAPDGLTGKLAQHYTDFWFDYPSGCEVLRQGREMPNNFVRVNRVVEGELAEQFNVGWFSVDQPDLELQAGIDQLVTNMKPALTGGARFEVLADGRTKVAGYDAYEYRVRQQVRKPGHEGTDSWIEGPNGERLPPPPELAAMMGTHETRVLGFVVIPKPGARSGVVLITLARGRPGSLAAVADSFRFGKP